MQRLEPAQEYNAAANEDEELNRLRQAVDKIFEEAELDIYKVTDELPATVRIPLTREGEPVDEIKRQRVKEAEQAVADAYETVLKSESSDPEQLSLA